LKTTRKSENFFSRVYAFVKRVPPGKVTTYGEIASALGTRDSRRVGHALHANRHGDRVPCHRVVNKDGRLAPNFAFDGAMEQRRRLQVEGVRFVDEMHVDLERCLWNTTNITNGK